MGNSVVITWGCHGHWDGSRNIGISGAIWGGPVTVARGEIVFQVPVSCCIGVPLAEKPSTGTAQQ